MSSNEPLADTNPRRIFVASLVALGTALLLLFTIIIPVEFNYDPLGTGRLLGLSALADAGAIPPLENQAEAHRTDFVEFYLEPFQSVEYKYQMDIDSPMVFSWVADGELVYDMHAEPAGLGAEYAESFEQGAAIEKSGSFHAPFTGIHGWFWENRKFQAVTLRVYTAGFYLNSTVFQDGSDFQKEIPLATER
jgi:hypothetical protein